MRKRILGLIGLFGILFFGMMCQTPSSNVHRGEEPSPEREKAINSLHEILSKTIARSGCPGAAVVVVKDTSIIYQKGFGVRSTKDKQPVDGETVFRLGSLSKGIAATLTAKLIDRGYLDWDDRVIDILPSFKLHDSAQTERITVAHLLSHSTGLPRHSFTNLIEAGLPMGKIWPRLVEVPLIGAEGVHHAYQNVSYAIIEDILEAKTGCSFESLLQEELLDPIGMKTASYSREHMLASTKIAMPHTAVAAGSYAPISITEKYYNAISAGGVNASTTDMAQYLKLLLGHYPEVVPVASIKEMTKPFINPPTRRRFDRWEGVDDAAYGMGWRVLDYQGRRIAYHSGSVNGYVSEIAVDLEHQIGICALFNAPVRVASEVIPIVWQQNLGECY